MNNWQLDAVSEKKKDALLKHYCRITGAEIIKRGLQDLTLTIFDVYDDPVAAECCEEHNSLEIKVKFCPECGWKDERENG